jgi:hypothetical protein
MLLMHLVFSLGFDSPTKIDSFTSSELVKLEAILVEVDQKAAKDREAEEGISCLKAIKEEDMVGERTPDAIPDEGGDALSVKGHGQRQKKPGKYDQSPCINYMEDVFATTKESAMVFQNITRWKGKGTKAG